MDEYIGRTALLEHLAQCKRSEDATTLIAAVITALQCFIQNQPAADVAEVVHGKWLRSDDDWNSLTTIQCSICGEEWCFETDDDVSLLNYKHCPNCGAKMDGRNDDAVD